MTRDPAVTPVSGPGEETRMSDPGGPRLTALDALIAVVLAAGMAVLVHRLFLLIGPGQFDRRNIDLWFDADGPRVFANIISRNSDHYRSAVHPLFSLLMFGPYHVLTALLHLTPVAAVAVMVSAQAGLWVASLYVMLRVFGLGAPGATAFTLAGAASASSIFLLPVVETFALNSVTMMWVFTFALIAARRGASDRALTLASALSLALTITNWWTGLLLASSHRPWRRALQITINALALVTALWVVQRALIPSVQYFFGSREDLRYLVPVDPARIAEVLTNIFLNPMVMPKAVLGRDGTMFTVQFADPRSASALGRVGVAIWLALLGLGVWAIRRGALPRRFLVVLLGSFAGFLPLYILYGGDTFLYSLLWLPLLVAVAGLAMTTPARIPALALALALAGCAAANNHAEFDRTVDQWLTRTAVRDRLVREMSLRPRDPWPRGRGHVVLAIPGTPDTLKGYVEPGGGFSPAAGSFGVSVWVIGPEGEPSVTGDDLPIAGIRQSFEFDSLAVVPALRNATPHYTIEWRALDAGRWRGVLVPAPGEARLALWIRSAGPAGGPIRALAADGATLRVNGRWSVTASGPTGPATWTLGSEHRAGWHRGGVAMRALDDPSGWGCARLVTTGAGPVTLTVTDDAPRATTDAALHAPVLAPRLEGFDPRFTACLEAQAAHLAMAITPDGLRPGDPLNYRFPWARDLACEAVALARAGQVEAARRLVRPFLERDYFGGFGAEADAPGLGIWALAEVEARGGGLDDSALAAVARKAAIIEGFLTSPDTTWGAFYGPVLPATRRDWHQSLVATPSPNGLVDGRMDQHRPVLHVSAVSYLGLRAAARLARKLDDTGDAARWDALADALREAWTRRFTAAEDGDDRTYISALWPSAVAADAESALAVRLETRWGRMRDAAGGYRVKPLYTYFPIAEAHQWLLLDRPERVWPTLRWFWDHESSPGLHTWWEGSDRDVPASGWNGVLGAARPGPATPHYWTAAEMLMLQLDMLAYETGDAPGDTLVIGAGVPAEWLGRRLAVRGMRLGSGRVSWEWDGRQVRVSAEGPVRAVRLGRAFPAGTPVVSVPRDAIAAR